jgi:hypothetical protein
MSSAQHAASVDKGLTRDSSITKLTKPSCGVVLENDFNAIEDENFIEDEEFIEDQELVDSYEFAEADYHSYTDVASSATASSHTTDCELSEREDERVVASKDHGIKKNDDGDESKNECISETGDKVAAIVNDSDDKGVRNEVLDKFKVSHFLRQPFQNINR